MSIIRPKGLNVHVESQADDVIPTIGPAIIKASAESILAEEDVLTASLISGTALRAPELKKYVSYRELMEADDHKLQISGRTVKCCCPFHTDRTPSFVINEADDFARCYGCRWYGDIFKYEQDFHEIGFREACRRINEFLRVEPRRGRKAVTPSARKNVDAPVFTPRQLVERKKYAERLASEAWLADMICQRRFEKTGEKWNSEVIRQLAQDEFLGWADCLAFIYPRGTKYRRWPDKEFIWESDGGSLWRGEKLAGAKHVYLTESETDTVAVLHTTIEDREGVAVIGMSGVNSFASTWAPLFQDKIVTFCFDNDKAGEDGVEKHAPVLQPYAKQLRTVDLKEVAQ